MSMLEPLRALHEVHAQQDADRRAVKRPQDAPIDTRRISLPRTHNSDSRPGGGSLIVPPPELEPETESPSGGKQQRSPLSAGSSKVLELFKGAQREEVRGPADCATLHQQLQEQLQAMDQCDLQNHLKELGEHHHRSYPTKDEQTYREKKRGCRCIGVFGARGVIVVCYVTAIRVHVEACVWSARRGSATARSEFLSSPPQPVLKTRHKLRIARNQQGGEEH